MSYRHLYDIRHFSLQVVKGLDLYVVKKGKVGRLGVAHSGKSCR